MSTLTLTLLAGALVLLLIGAGIGFVLYCLFALIRHFWAPAIPTLHMKLEPTIEGELQ